MGGGYFQFFTKNLPQKHQKRTILHTSQANAPLATLLITPYTLHVDLLKWLRLQKGRDGSNLEPATRSSIVQMNQQ